MINSPKLTQPTVKHPVLSWYGRIINCYVTFMYSTLQCALVHNLEHPHCKKILFSDISLRRFCFHWNVTKSLIQDPYYLLLKLYMCFFLVFQQLFLYSACKGNRPHDLVMLSTGVQGHMSCRCRQHDTPAWSCCAWTHVMQMPAAWYPCLLSFIFTVQLHKSLLIQ